MSTVPIVAIIGYPNVGKSTLFNRLVGERDAVVSPEPGVTRDRKSRGAEWSGRVFEVLDTGGIDLRSGEEMAEQVRMQATVGVASADLVIFMLDGTRGIGPQEHEIADISAQWCPGDHSCQQDRQSCGGRFGVGSLGARGGRAVGNIGGAWPRDRRTAGCCHRRPARGKRG